MRRSIPLLVLLLATASACGQAPRRSDSARLPAANAPPSVQAVAPATADMAAPESRAGRAGAGPDVSTRPRRPASPSTIATPSALAAPRVAEAAGAPRAAVRAADRRPLPDHRHALSRASATSDVEAMLAFKLDPAIARQFGRESVDAVIQAEGMLTESEISGTDVGTGIQRRRPRHRRARAPSCSGSRRGSPSATWPAPSASGSKMRRSNCATRSPRLRANRDEPAGDAGDDADGVPLRLGRSRPGLSAAPSASASRWSAPARTWSRAAPRSWCC